MKVPVEISARHVHLDKKTKEILFPNVELTKKYDLSQIGQFACNETISIKSDFFEIKNVRILGPLRDRVQVEITKTDSYNLKIEAPLRLSGELCGAGSIKLISQYAEIEVENAVIIAKRHIHVDPLTSNLYNLNNNDIVSIKINSERGGVLDNVIVRVSDKAKYMCHLDVDESNACDVKTNDLVEIIRK